MSEKPTNNEISLNQTELISRATREGKEYRKTTTTKARPLTQRDFEEYRGIIKTKEGPVTFQIGDYLAVGVEGEEWPVSKATMQRTKRLIETGTEKNGAEWGSYENINTVRAIQINELFQVELENGSVIHGKIGDYFVYDGSSCWITDKKIFESTYFESKKETPE